MNIRIYDTYDQMSRAAADFVIAQLLLKPESHIGLTAGKTPVGMFAALVDSYRSGAVGFGQATFYNLEEKFGLAADDPATCRNYFHRHLLDHTDITDDQLLLPDQPADDLAPGLRGLRCTSEVAARPSAGYTDPRHWGKRTHRHEPSQGGSVPWRP